MANTRSAIKRVRQNPKRRLRNRLVAGSARTFIKKARTSFEKSSIEDARTATLQAISALDKAASKGVLHKNNAARRKGRLMRQLAKMQAK